jgi:hypothetical protein
LDEAEATTKGKTRPKQKRPERCNAEAFQRSISMHYRKDFLRTSRRCKAAAASLIKLTIVRLACADKISPRTATALIKKLGVAHA